MFTAVWRATDKVLEALRNEIVVRNKISNQSTIKLSVAPVHVARCNLLMSDSSGQFQEIATSSTSGIPPYSAVFNATLTEEQIAYATAAVNGRAGYLAIEYDSSLITPVTVSGRLVPQSVRFVPWLREYLSVGHSGLRSAIEEAIKEGLVAIQLSVPEDPTGKLISALYDRLLTRASELLPELIETWDEYTYTDLEVEVTLVEDVSQPFHPRTDLSRLDFNSEGITFTGDSTLSMERVVRSTMEMSRPLRVELDFPPDDAPLAWIRLQRGDSEAILKPPNFSPVLLPANHTSQPLMVTVSYTNGEHSHKEKIVSTNEDELLLIPQHVGLTVISVDAQPLAQTGARSAQIWLRYSPLHRRDEQRHTIQFREGNWISQWWLATPAVSALSYLEYKWTAMTADGRIVTNSFEHAGSVNITLFFPGGTTNVTNR